MRVCDRCGAKVIADTCTFKKYGSDVDLCRTCLDDFEQWIDDSGGDKSREDKEKVAELSEKKRRGRPPAQPKSELQEDQNNG